MEYLDYYGLDFDPFELPVDSIFSSAGGRVQLLEKIEHLVAFSELNIFVYGQQGIGKTNFLKHLIESPSAMWRSIYLPVSAEFVFDDILELILSEYNLSLTQNSSLSVVAAEISEVLQLSNQSVLLLSFDDAHHLPNEIFNQLLELKKAFEKFEIQIKILFVGEQEGLEANCDYAEDSRRSYHLFLEPLSLDDTKIYLLSYFQKAGKSEKLPLSSFDIKRIFEMSQGIPYKINIITPEYLLQALDQPSKNLRLPVIRVMLGLLGLIILIALFYFKQSQLNEEINIVPKKDNIEKLVLNSSVMQKLEAASEVIDLSEKNVELDTKVEAMVESGLIGMGVLKEVQTKVNTHIEPVVELLTHDESDIMPAADLIPKVDLIKENIDIALNISQVAVQQKILEINHFTVSNDWFRSNSGWVLQVLGSHKEINVDEFVAKYPQYQWRKYQRILNAKIYFVIVLSGFDTKAEAAKVLVKTPSEIRKLTPWNRSIESIRPLLDH
ncbi:MAG: AAA family ATPase [Saccharospirillaceae bacterium]|nr:AAA family ATPase [Pseudomonadales bacterium]NRB78281.1 AAA family ATPase [Saccharospirillaceae bacterium]